MQWIKRGTNGEGKQTINDCNVSKQTESKVGNDILLVSTVLFHYANVNVKIRHLYTQVVRMIDVT